MVGGPLRLSRHRGDGRARPVTMDARQRDHSVVMNRPPFRSTRTAYAEQRGVVVPVRHHAVDRGNAASRRVFIGSPPQIPMVRNRPKTPRRSVTRFQVPRARTTDRAPHAGCTRTDRRRPSPRAIGRHHRYARSGPFRHGPEAGRHGGEVRWVVGETRTARVPGVRVYIGGPSGGRVGRRGLREPTCSLLPSVGSRTRVHGGLVRTCLRSRRGPLFRC